MTGGGSGSGESIIVPRPEPGEYVLVQPNGTWCIYNDGACHPKGGGAAHTEQRWGSCDEPGGSSAWAYEPGGGTGWPPPEHRTIRLNQHYTAEERAYLGRHAGWPPGPTEGALQRLRKALANLGRTVIEELKKRRRIGALVRWITRETYDPPPPPPKGPPPRTEKPGF